MPKVGPLVGDILGKLGRVLDALCGGTSMEQLARARPRGTDTVQRRPVPGHTCAMIFHGPSGARRSPGRTATARPRRHSGPIQVEPGAHFSGLAGMAAGLRRARDQDRRVRRAAGHARAGPRPAAGGDEAVRRHRPAHLQGLVFRVAEVRRGSAGQPDQRAAPAGADSVREGEPGERVVQSRAAEDPAADGPAVDGGQRRAGRLSFRDRGPLPPAGARARRQGRAPALAREPLLVVAERRVRRALDRRHQAPDDQAVRRARRSR